MSKVANRELPVYSEVCGLEHLRDNPIYVGPIEYPRYEAPLKMSNGFCLDNDRHLIVDISNKFNYHWANLGCYSLKPANCRTNHHNMCLIKQLSNAYLCCTVLVV
jgi:hypothetical protein